MSKLNERRREIRAMTAREAQQELATLRRRLFDLRLQHERGEVKNNRLFAQTKVDVARLMQHLGDLQHAAQVAAEGGLDDEETAEAVSEEQA